MVQCVYVANLQPSRHNTYVVTNGVNDTFYVSYMYSSIPYIQRQFGDE